MKLYEWGSQKYEEPKHDYIYAWAGIPEKFREEYRYNYFGGSRGMRDCGKYWNMDDIYETAENVRRDFDVSSAIASHTSRQREAFGGSSGPIRFPKIDRPILAEKLDDETIIAIWPHESKSWLKHLSNINVWVISKDKKSADRWWSIIRNRYKQFHWLEDAEDMFLEMPSDAKANVFYSILGEEWGLSDEDPENFFGDILGDDEDEDEDENE